jgi:hypothetical protein
VLHDFDIFGFRIFGTLTRNTKRYEWQHAVEVIDLGLRLVDDNLMSESCRCKSNTTNRVGMEKNGATEEEIEFLCSGKRVELNAFDTVDLIEWIETKLKQHGVQKIVPDQPTLELAYRRARHLGRVGKQMDEAREQLENEWIAKISELATEDSKLKVPKSLARDVKTFLKQHPSATWEGAVSSISRAREKKQEGGRKTNQDSP